MSKRAQYAAMKAYPIQGKWVGNQYGEWDDDINQELRKAFSQGYEQAEKDTIERACQWLFDNFYNYDRDLRHAIEADFRKAMEAEQ